MGRGWAREERTMVIICHLLFRAARNGYHLEIRHVPGADNGPADALSRGDGAAFRRRVLGADLQPAPLPTGWAECVLDQVRETHRLSGVHL